MKLCTTLALFALAASAAARPAWESISGGRAHFHARTVAPKPWTQSRPAALTDSVDFIVAVKQQRLDELARRWEAVADPTSPSFGQFMTVDEIRELVSIPELTNRVMSWLVESGVPAAAFENRGDSVVVRGVPAPLVAKLFDTELHVFTHPQGTELVRQMGRWSVPESLAEAVELVSGLAEFPPEHMRVRRSRGALRANAANGDIVPRSIRSLYNIPEDEVAGAQSSQGVIEFQDSPAYTDADMASFYSTVADEVETINHIVGPFNNQSESVESVLDIQYIVGVGKQADNYYWTAKNWLYAFASDFANAASVPSVVSMSYGWSEAQQCRIDQSECSHLGVDSTGFVERTNAEFAKIGLRGVSLLASSGDSGANGRTDSYCSDSVLHPTYPAASPYVTAVGATQVKDPKIGSFPEEVCKSQYQCIESGTEVAVSYDVAHFTSGGGFSNVAARPAWQEAAVQAYLYYHADTLPPTSYFNASGRAYPDISAIGNNFVIVQGGRPSTVGGTSASSPTVAGIVALLNGARQKAGKKPLGPLNPILYKMYADEPAAFNDVTEGDNKCTEQGCGLGGSCKGFTAVKGFDPVTGLGTPNYAKMRAYVLNLP